MNSTTVANFKTILTVMLFGALIGALYTSVVYLSQPNPEGTIWIGVFIGMFLAGGASTFELFAVSSPESKIRALPFYASFLIRILVHLTVIIVSISLVQFIYFKLTGIRIFLLEDNFTDVITDVGFSIAVIAIIIFWMQMRVFIGGRTLKNLIVGKYHKPQNEERIFMIVDVIGSTAATQEIGDSNFHTYLNKLFILFDQTIHRNGGEVHSYVGDAVFVMWPFENDPKDNQRIFDALRELHEVCKAKHDMIVAKFGIAPRFRAAIHGGPIVVGEMGHHKRQITYLGNTLNLTARLEGLSKELDIPYLVTDDVLSRSILPEGLLKNSLGEKSVKGSARRLAVSEIVIEAKE